MDWVQHRSGTDQHMLAMQGLTGTWGWHGSRMINMCRLQLLRKV